MIAFNPTHGGLRSDKWGDGSFGASRGDRIHEGCDVLGLPGSYVVSPVDGKVVRTGMPYGDGGPWDCYLLIREDDRTDWRLFYVIPLVGIVGTTVRKGQAVAILADVGQKYGTDPVKGRMDPHCHVEKHVNGQKVDPEIL